MQISYFAVMDNPEDEAALNAELARLRAIEAAARELMFLFVESDIPEHNRPKAAALRAALEARS